MPNQDEWLWLHWTQQEPTNGKVKVECNYCKSASQLRNATKCRTHTIKCSQTPKEVRQLFVSMVNKKTNKNTECHDLDDEEEKSDEEVDSSPVPISWSQSSQPKVNKILNAFRCHRNQCLQTINFNSIAITNRLRQI